MTKITNDDFIIIWLGVTPQTPTPFNLMKGNSILDFLMLEISTLCIQILSSVKTRKYQCYLTLYIYTVFSNLIFLMITIVFLTLNPSLLKIRETIPVFETWKTSFISWSKNIIIITTFKISKNQILNSENRKNIS